MNNQQMTPEQALRLLSKYQPCPHHNVDTTLGNGKEWARCQDCREMLSQNSLERLSQASDDFELAISVLTKAIHSDINSPVTELSLIGYAHVAKGFATGIISTGEQCPVSSLADGSFPVWSTPEIHKRLNSRS